MKHIKSLYILTSLILILSFTPSFAGPPWLQKKGHGFYKLSLWGVVSDKHYTDTGEIDPNITTGYFNTNLYAEYGITDKLMGVLYFPLFVRNYYNNQISATTGETIIKGEAINTIGDIDISMTYGLITNKPFVMSGTLLLGLPTGSSSGKGELGILQTGDGEFNQMLKLDMGGSFSVGNLPFYSSGYIGFNNRTRGYSDELRFGFEVGATLFEKLIAIARFTGIHSFKNGDPNVGSSDGATLFANNAEYLSFSPEVAYQITDKVGVTFTYGTVFYGRLIFANPSYSGGIYIKI